MKANKREKAAHKAHTGRKVSMSGSTKPPAFKRVRNDCVHDFIDSESMNIETLEAWLWKAYVAGQRSGLK